MTIKIFLGNLSSETTSDKIRPLFEKYGEVVECDVLKNFGFVHMVNKNEANKAIAQLDGYSIDGNNIRVELSTGKSRGGGTGKFDKKGFGGFNRSRPYGPPGGRGDPRDLGRYPYPPLGPVGYDRYDPYYRYYMDREAAYLSRVASLPGERAYPPAAARDRYPPVSPRDRLPERFPPEPRERLPPPRSYLEERPRASLTDPYLRERDPLAARPPPEYYDRKPLAVGRPEPAMGVTGRGGSPYGNGVGGGDYYRGLDRSGVGLGGAAAGGGGGDYFRQGSGAGQGAYGRAGLGGRPGDSQSSFAQDAILF